MNGAGDLNDLVKAVDKKGRPDFDKMTHKEVKRYTRENDRCSVLIKVWSYVAYIVRFLLMPTLAKAHFFFNKLLLK